MKSPVPSDESLPRRRDEPVTPAVLERAIAQGRSRHGGHPHLHGQEYRATKIQYWPDSHSLVIGFAGQPVLAIQVMDFPELAGLTPDELGELSVGFGGSALCLDSKDLHVSIAGLILRR